VTIVVRMDPTLPTSQAHLLTLGTRRLTDGELRQLRTGMISEIADLLLKVSERTIGPGDKVTFSIVAEFKSGPLPAPETVDG